MFGLGEGGQGNDGNGSGGLVAFERASHIKPRDVGEPYIQQNKGQGGARGQFRALQSPTLFLARSSLAPRERHSRASYSIRCPRQSGSSWNGLPPGLAF